MSREDALKLERGDRVTFVRGSSRVEAEVLQVFERNDTAEVVLRLPGKTARGHLYPSFRRDAWQLDRVKS